MTVDTRPAADQLARPFGGKAGKVCAKCGDEKQWRKHSEGKHGARATCHRCFNAGAAKYRADNRDKANARNRTIKRECIEHLGGACQDCMRNDYHDAVYEFHHRDPSLKSFAISTRKSFNADVRAELAKCDLLCANCHRTRHATEGETDEV